MANEIAIEDVRAAAEAEMKRLFGDPLPRASDFEPGGVPMKRHGNAGGPTINIEASVYAGVSAFAQGLLERLAGHDGSVGAEPLDASHEGPGQTSTRRDGSEPRRCGGSEPRGCGPALR